MGRALITLLRFLVLLALLWAIGLGWFVIQIPMQPSDNTEHTDAIVVLTGGALRLEHGFELLAAQRADRMFISGVEDGVSLPSLLKKKEYHAFEDRINAASITLGYKARSTLGNAEETAEWIAREHIKSIRLVTGNYHIPRSVFELHQTVPDLIIVADPVFPGHFEHNGWWRSGDSVRLVLLEYHKYVASVIGHRLLAFTW